MIKLENLAVVCGVIATFFLAVWWSDVVASGRAPGSIHASHKASDGSSQTSDPGNRATPRKASPHTAEHEEYCKDAEKPKDCIIQLRTAEATEQQAKIAWLALLLAFPTILLTAFGLWFVKQTMDANRRAADEAAKAATAAAHANQLSRELFVATERPWIKVEIAIGGALEYNVNGLNVTLLFTLTNVGRSPAVYTNINPRIWTFTGDQIDLRAQQRKQLAELRARPFGGWGYTIFPGDKKYQRHTLSISPEDIEKAKAIGSFLMPTVEGFVSYAFVFDRTVRVTSFGVSIKRRDKPRPATDKERRATDAIFIDDGDMPAEDLSIGWFPLSEEYAD